MHGRGILPRLACLTLPLLQRDHIRGGASPRDQGIGAVAAIEVRIAAVFPDGGELQERANMMRRFAEPGIESLTCTGVHLPDTHLHQPLACLLANLLVHGGPTYLSGSRCSRH